jgi:TfoX/Sxy family transcriptional regulator of competence genes
MAHDPKALQKAMVAAMPPDVDWRFKPMFGGIGVYANDRMCVSLSDVGLAVKLTGNEHAALLKVKGAKVLQYEPSSPPSKTYVVVPGAMLADRKSLNHWLSICAQQAAQAPVKKPRKIRAAATASRGRSRTG